MHVKVWLPLAVLQERKAWLGESCPALCVPTPQAWTSHRADAAGCETALKQIGGRNRISKRQQIFPKYLLKCRSHWRNHSMELGPWFKPCCLSRWSQESYLLRYLAVVRLIKLVWMPQSLCCWIIHKGSGILRLLVKVQLASNDPGFPRWCVFWCPLCSRDFRATEVTALWFQHLIAAV